jgi:23S rRNA (guanosine2251-2'-O)-methyltransferase|tara:strand:- start:1360 stop:2103 length:744 start_codon:yes stop_codon:yes gene_type:complete
MEDKIEIYGIHAILEAIESENNIEKVWMLKGNRGSLFQRLEQSLRQNNIPHSYVPKERLERFKNKNHQGAIASISKIEFIEVEELIESAFKNNDSPTFILLDGITDARNVGAILRSCAATGVNGLIIPQTGSAPINDATIKTSAGGAFKVPISRVNHLKDAVYLLKSYKTQIIAVSEKSNENLFDLKIEKAAAIIMGSEDKGIQSSLLKICDSSIKLPMEKGVDSLNVSVACGIVLYEKIRQQLASK